MATEDLNAELNTLIETKGVSMPEPGDDDFSPQADVAAPSGAEKVEQPTTEGEPAGEKKTEGEAVDPAKAAEKKDDLPLEEIRKRFEDQKGLAKKEREMRRAIEAEREQMRAQLAQVQQEMAQFQARMRAAQNKAPDPEEDVIGALKHTQQELQAYRQQEAMIRQQQMQQYQQMQFVNNLKTKVEDFEAEFREENPDYDEASNWLVDFEQERLESVGIPKPQAEQAAINWAINMANIMLSQGKNPAEIAYSQAKRMGWQSKAAPKVDPAAQAAAELAKKNAEAEAKIKAAQAGGAAAKTMSGGGTANTGDQSLASGVQLKGAAFDSWAERFLSGR